MVLLVNVEFAKTPLKPLKYIALPEWSAVLLMNLEPLINWLLSLFCIYIAPPSTVAVLFINSQLLRLILHADTEPYLPRLSLKVHPSTNRVLWSSLLPGWFAMAEPYPFKFILLVKLDL